MTFSVEPQALREFGTWLDEMTDQTEAAISYAGHARIDNGGHANLMLKIIPAVEEIAASSDEVFRHLRDALSASATEIFGTARLYEDLDAATAAALDEAAHR